MKKFILKNYLLIALLFTGILMFSCDNDDDTYENDDTCEYEGFTFVDANDDMQTMIPEADLTTHLFPNQPGVEIYKTAQPSGTNGMHFTTDIITEGVSGTGNLHFNGNSYTVNVTCQRAGTAVGEELRYDLTTANGTEAEFCVTIDQVNP